MAVNVYAGQLQVIQFALTAGKDKDPVDASPLSRVKLELFNRDNFTLLATVDSQVDAGVFFWVRTQTTVKGVLIWLLEMELHNEGLPIQEDMVARLTLYDGNFPLGVSWKQFALNSRT